MKEKPILFNSEMVRAILDGRKTVTRRLIRPQPMGQLCFIMGGSHPGKWHYTDMDSAKAWDIDPDRILPKTKENERERERLWTPPCLADELLWVRETWTRLTFHDQEMIFYKADGEPDTSFLDDDRVLEDYRVRWQPSIHMPRSAARIFLKVKRVRVERVQDITNEEAKAEGVTCATDNSGMMHRHKFRTLWDSVSEEGSRWDDDPWVWVIEFERVVKKDADGEGKISS